MDGCNFTGSRDITDPSLSSSACAPGQGRRAAALGAEQEPSSAGSGEASQADQPGWDQPSASVPPSPKHRHARDRLWRAMRSHATTDSGAADGEQYWCKRASPRPGALTGQLRALAASLEGAARSQHEVVQSMASASLGMQHILNDILTLDKIEQGALQLEPAPFPPSHMVSNVLRTFALELRNKAITLRPEWAVEGSER